MVDPDSRRPVDHRMLRDWVSELEPRLARTDDRLAVVGDLLDNWRDGRVKLALTLLLLRLRRDHEALFAGGSYEPVAIRGEHSDLAFGYMRSGAGRRLAVLIARFPGRREANPEWTASALLPEGQWTDALFGRPIEPSGEVALSALLTPLPFAVLESAAP
jgi:(1->4)-alpha-D-glucan 1-alpha-D-glucosylmutase